MRGQAPGYDSGMTGLLAAATLKRPELSASLSPRDAGAEWLSEVVYSCVGTGGRVSELTSCGLEGTSVYIVVEFPKARLERAVLHDTPGQLALIRATLSLNVKELAAALNVKRPTVYAWMAGEAEPKERNHRRIEVLWTLAREWEKLSSLPLGALRTAPDEDGSSILTLLTASEIDMERVQRLMHAAAEKAKAAHDKAHGLGVRERARRKGVILATPPDAQRQIDLRTGKRMGPE